MAKLPPAKDWTSWEKLIRQLTWELKQERAYSPHELRALSEELRKIAWQGQKGTLAAQEIRNRLSQMVEAFQEESEVGLRGLRGGRSAQLQILEETPRDQLAEQIKAWKKGSSKKPVSQMLAEAGIQLSPEEIAQLKAQLHSYEIGNTGKMGVASGWDLPLPDMPVERPPEISEQGLGYGADPLNEAEVGGLRGMMRTPGDREATEKLAGLAYQKMQHQVAAGASFEEALLSLSPQEQKAWMRLQAFAGEDSVAGDILYLEERDFRNPPTVEKAPFHEKGAPPVGSPPKDVLVEVPNRARRMREPHNMEAWKRELMELRKQKQIPKDFDKTREWRNLWNAGSPKQAGAAASQVRGEELQQALMERLQGREIPSREYALERLRMAAQTKGGNPKVAQLLKAVESGDVDRIRQLKLELKALEAAGDPGISLLLRNLKRPADRATQLLRNVPKWAAKLPL